MHRAGLTRPAFGFSCLPKKVQGSPEGRRPRPPAPAPDCRGAGTRGLGVGSVRARARYGRTRRQYRVDRMLDGALKGGWRASMLLLPRYTTEFAPWVPVVTTGRLVTPAFT